MNDIVLGALIGAAFGIAGNVLELFLFAKYTSKRTIRELEAYLTSERAIVAVDGLATAMSNSPRMGELADAVVHAVGDSAKRQIMGTIGGLRKGVAAAERDLEDAAITEINPELGLLSKVFEKGKKGKKKGIDLGEAVRAYALMTAQNSQNMPGSPGVAAPKTVSGGSTW